MKWKCENTRKKVEVGKKRRWKSKSKRTNVKMWKNVE